MRFWLGTVIGEPVSKANSRIPVSRITPDGRPYTAFIKSTKANKYSLDVMKQVPVLYPLLAGRLRVTARLFYSTERPDLDPSVLFDALAGRIYRNDRQLREWHLYHEIDRKNPRVVIRIEEIAELDLQASDAAKERRQVQNRPSEPLGLRS